VPRATCPVEQLPCLHARDSLDHDPDAGDLLGGIEQLVGGGAALARLRPLLQLLDALAEPLDGAHHVVLGHPEELGELVEPLAAVSEELGGARAR